VVVVIELAERAVDCPQDFVPSAKDDTVQKKSEFGKKGARQYYKLAIFHSNTYSKKIIR
jgi:hypothetical protein